MQFQREDPPAQPTIADVIALIEQQVSRSSSLALPAQPKQPFTNLSDSATYN